MPGGMGIQKGGDYRLFVVRGALAHLHWSVPHGSLVVLCNGQQLLRDCTWTKHQQSSPLSMAGLFQMWNINQCCQTLSVNIHLLCDHPAKTINGNIKSVILYHFAFFLPHKGRQDGKWQAYHIQQESTLSECAHSLSEQTDTVLTAFQHGTLNSSWKVVNVIYFWSLKTKNKHGWKIQSAGI